MAYYLSKFLTRLAEETKSAKELLVNLIAANFPVERANRLIIIIIIIILFFLFFIFYFYRESNCMSLTGQTVMWSDVILWQTW